MTDTEATAPAGNAETNIQPQIARTLARTLNKMEKGRPEEQQSRWQEKKTLYTQQGRMLVRALVKEGFVFTLDPELAAKNKRGGGVKAKRGGGRKGNKGAAAAATTDTTAE